MTTKADRAEIKKRERLARAIANLNDRDFEMIIFLLLGNECEQRLAFKILCDMYPECTAYRTACSVS